MEKLYKKNILKINGALYDYKIYGAEQRRQRLMKWTEQNCIPSKQKKSLLVSWKDQSKALAYWQTKMAFSYIVNHK